MTKEYTLHQAKKIAGWMTDAELLFLAKIASQSRIIFEIGSYVGRSTRVLADNTEGKVYAIDPWKGTNYQGDEKTPCFNTNELTFNTFYCNLADKINDGTVIPITKSWNDFHTEIRPDMIFIDGDHRYESVKRDIEKALELYPKYLLGHDYANGWPGVIKAVEEFFPGKIQLEDTIWWLKF